MLKVDNNPVCADVRLLLSVRTQHTKTRLLAVLNLTSSSFVLTARGEETDSVLIFIFIVQELFKTKLYLRISNRISKKIFLPKMPNIVCSISINVECLSYNVKNNDFAKMINE